MKRLSVLAISLIVATSSFAYYGSYSSSDDGWFTFIGIVMIVWGILEIILFFKIWGMTNNIKALKKDHFNETVFETKEKMAMFLRRNLVLGNMENVKRTLLQNFIDNVENGYMALPASDFVKDEKGNDKLVSFKEDNLNKSITPYVDNLIFLYGKIGEDAPVYITRMKTFRDYYNIFVKEELEVKIKKESEGKGEPTL